MKRIHIFVLLTLSLIIVSCGRGQEKLPTLVLHPHEEMPDSIDLKSYKSVFLAGTIDMGSGVDWQKDVAELFEKAPGNWVLFNPRQEFWDPGRENEMDYQVNWELSAFGGRRLYSHEFSSGQQVSDYASGIGPVCEKRKALCSVHGRFLQI